MTSEAMDLTAESELDVGGGLPAAQTDFENAADAGARPIPRISIQAFCDTEQAADTIEAAAGDRRLTKAHVSIHMGGIPAAVAHYQESPTPNLIIVESRAERRDLLHELDQLAECCDAGTRVIVIGHVNDVILYRELIKRGVNEYVIAPIKPMQVMESISNLYNDPDADPVGHVFAFVGAKGGVGSSTICHNVAWTLSEALNNSVVISDFDLAFGTTGLDFNQDPVQGMAEALSSPERLDEVLLDRLLTKCSEHLSIFAPPVLLDRDYDLSPEACETVVDVVRQNVPYVAVDIPHTWAPWSKKLLSQADQVVITASPDLANLRNAKNMVDLLRTTRKNDADPHLILNMTGIPKRPEITAKDFEQALEIPVAYRIDYDAETFGQAANNGQMVEEMNPKAKVVSTFHELAMALTNKQEAKHDKKKSGGLAPLLEKLKLGRG